MKILPFHKEIHQYLKRRGLQGNFEKQKKLFENNPFHPSLNTELMEPRRMRIWSFRLDRKYRVLFFFKTKNTIEVIDVNDHYQ